MKIGRITGMDPAREDLFGLQIQDLHQMRHVTVSVAWGRINFFSCLHRSY